MVYWTLHSRRSQLHNQPLYMPINQQCMSLVDCMLIKCADSSYLWSIWLLYEHEGDLLADYQPGLWLAAWDENRFVSSQWSLSQYAHRQSIREIFTIPEAYAVHLELANAMGNEPRTIITHDQLKPYLLSDTSIDEFKLIREFGLAACPRMTYKSLITTPRILNLVVDLRQAVYHEHSLVDLSTNESTNEIVNSYTNKPPTPPDSLDAFREFMDGC